MTPTQSNNDSQLNHVDVSFYEFLGSAWKNQKNAKLNPEALEMLLVKTDGIPETNAPDIENKNTKFEDQQFIQKSNVKHSFVNALKSGTIVQAFKNAAIQVVRNNNNPARQQSARKTKPSPTQKSGNPLSKYGCVKGKK